jgi:hypothetical protein
MPFLCRQREKVEVQLQSIRNLDARKRWVVSPTFRPLYLGKDPVPVIQEVDWTSRPVWTCRECLTLTGIRSPDSRARSESLYRLRHPARLYCRYQAQCSTYRVSWLRPPAASSTAFIIIFDFTRRNALS